MKFIGLSLLCLTLSISLLSSVYGDLLQQNRNANIQRIFSMVSALKYGENRGEGKYAANDNADETRAGKKDSKITRRSPDISEFRLVNDTHAYALVTWTHFDSKVLYILTCNKIQKYDGEAYCIGESNIYRSTDYGTTFNKENYKFQNQSQISAIYTSPTDRNVIQVCDQHNQAIYSSTNEGDFYSLRQVAFSPLSLSFHPRFSNYILVQDTKSNVYLTNDTGRNWYFVSPRVNKFFWADKDSSYPSQIFLEVTISSAGKFSKHNYSTIYVAEIPFNGYVKEFSHELGPIDPYSFALKQDYLFIWRKMSVGSSRLFASYKKASFKECSLPDNDFHTKFHIIDASDGEIMLAALNKSGWTSLFISDKTGTKFSLALKNIKASWSTKTPIIDLHQVSGLPGAFLANQVDQGTLISYNKGGSWKSLTPPSYDMEGKSTECMLPDCKLRLSLNIRDSYAAGWSPVTSSKSAPGIIVAQGWLEYTSLNTAKHLSTYVSSDGGQTWKQVLKGRQVVKLLDHGGIIAAIPLIYGFSVPEMNTLTHSCDGGSVWISAVLSNQAERLIGVAAHPSAKASLLTIFAVDETQGKKMTWNVWRVNFSSIFEHKCSPQNYTLWTATSNLATGACVLGQRYVYQRRKSDICCYNGLDYKPLVNVSRCECTVHDFVCDFGFKRNMFESLCVPTSFAVTGPPVNCPEGGSYVKSKGYVKVIGDRCQGGIADEIKPVKVQCPARAPDGLSLSVKKYSIALGKSAAITLNQKSGFLGTKYSWNFGDNVKKYNLSFEDAKVQNHTYKQVGKYIIELFAYNKAGSYTAKTVLRVIERVSEIFLHVTKPVVANEEAVYTVTVKTHGKKGEQEHGFIHFAWIFEPIKTPVLSLNPTVRHTYSKTGTYEVEVQVFNAISVVSTTTTVTVFGDVRVISLQFSSTLDLLNMGTREWNDKFKRFIYEYLIRAFNIRKDMVEVEVSMTLPTIVTLSLVQNKVQQKEKQNKQGQSIDDVMHAIIDRVRSKKLVFFILGQEIRVLSAEIIRDKKVEKSGIVKQPKSSSNWKMYVYITAPVAFIIITILLYVAYKRLRKTAAAKQTNYLQMEEESDNSGLQQFGLENFVQT